MVVAMSDPARVLDLLHLAGPVGSARAEGGVAARQHRSADSTRFARAIGPVSDLHEHRRQAIAAPDAEAMQGDPARTFGRDENETAGCAGSKDDRCELAGPYRTQRAHLRLRRCRIALEAYRGTRAAGEGE